MTQNNNGNETTKNALIATTLLACILFATAGASSSERESRPSDIRQWKLLAFDNFNKSKDGSENEFSMFGENRVLGGHGSTTQKLSISVSESTYQDLKIVFDYYLIDSWDDEFATLEAQVHYSDGTSGPKKMIWKEGGHAHFFPNNIGGSIYRDYRTTVRALVDGMNMKKRVIGVDLDFKAHLDSLGRDESWGVDNLEIFGR